jgi:Metallo-peptidase family M12
MDATCKKLLMLTLPRRTLAPVYIFMFSLAPLLLSVLAKKKNFTLDDLSLKKTSSERSDFPVQVLQSGVDNVETIRDVDGNVYDLSQLKPFVGLFSEDTFSPSSDDTLVVDKRTGDIIRVSVFKAVYEDGSTILMEKDDNNNIEYVEVRRRVEEADTFLFPKEDGQTAEFHAFTSDDIDYETLQSQYHYGEHYLHRRMENEMIDEYLTPNLRYRQERAEFETSSFTSLGYGTCDSYTLVKVAIVFDGDLCSIYGSFEAARRRIMTIVASASFHYERDMCVQLQLTDISMWWSRSHLAGCFIQLCLTTCLSFILLSIVTPDKSKCSPTSSFFEGYNRNDACATSDSFLTQFTKLMIANRGPLRFDEDATVHMFTGFAPPGGTIGCAYVASFCNNEYTYGVEYMSFSINPYSQGVGKSRRSSRGDIQSPSVIAPLNTSLLFPLKYLLMRSDTS